MNQDKLFIELEKTINSLNAKTISKERMSVLQPLVDYIIQKRGQKEEIRLNFICTHNSRRSHLSQIWAQTMAHYFNVDNLSCYSGGTEATAMFPKVGETLTYQGFEILKLSDDQNPIYAVNYSGNKHPVICFSKTYDDSFNPDSGFGAIMTCDSANEACPMVVGAEARFPITYEDPKAFDGTEQQSEKYLERSIQIATELFWVFQSVSEA
ncbi:protein-tyrosine-phosphatase [Croceivirga thetidis]|uniref:Protein-tyrosine-phosphatase n=1 Tax=Croceivirga thetidis TaxID=2721623 RepID=A0ABX1GLS7_9FLAO|nr:protein-tyrosine-phosphatase [Croceivirga thetidis]NKI30838.1 protein-tyrosine-phosphatase [Croceivirga thetidis]